MAAFDYSDVPLEIREKLALRDAQYAAANERGAAFAAVQAAMDSVEGVASSYNGEVRVTVSSRGLLTGVQITSRGLALGPRALSSVFTTTLREALLNLQTGVSEAVRAVDAGIAAETVIAEANVGLASPLSVLENATSTPRSP